MSEKHFEMAAPPAEPADDVLKSRQERIKEAGAIQQRIDEIIDGRELSELDKKELLPVLNYYKQIRDLGREADTKLPDKLAEQLITAKEIMGATEFMGPIEVEQAYGIKINPKEIPTIPFSKAELKTAKELGQFLVLRASKDAKGQPLTMKGVRQALLDHRYEESLKGKITVSKDYGEEAFWKGEQIELKWALTSKEVIPDSTGKNYLQQTEQLVKYLEEKVFKGKAMPAEFKTALAEFRKYCDKNFKGKTEEEIQGIIGGSEWKKYAEEISELKINQLTRQTPAEILYDIFIYYQNNNKRILEKTRAWSKRRNSDGRLVNVGNVGADGAGVNSWRPDTAGPLGASFSRSSS